MIKTIIFDFGNVIGFFSHRLASARLAYLAATTPEAGDGRGKRVLVYTVDGVQGALDQLPVQVGHDRAAYAAQIDAGKIRLAR